MGVVGERFKGKVHEVQGVQQEEVLVPNLPMILKPVCPST